MEIQQIKYFLAVVDFGTFLAASEKVHVSQPTLSAGIKKLESSLDMVLFHRGSRAATLTPAGVKFLEQVRVPYNDLLAIKGDLAKAEQLIRVGIINTVPFDKIVQAIGLFRAANTNVFIELEVGNDSSLNSKMSQGDLQLLFTSASESTKRFTPLFEEQLMVAVSAKHSLSRREGIDLRELHQMPFIERLNCESWDKIHEYFYKQNTEPRSVFKAESDDVILSMVNANLGVSIMPMRETNLDIRFLKISDLSIKRLIGIQESSQPLSPYVQKLHRMIVDTFHLPANIQY